MMQMVEERNIKPDHDIACIFVDHTGFGKIHKPDFPLSSYIGFTRKFGIVPSAKLLHVLITKTIQSIDYSLVSNKLGKDGKTCVIDSTSLQKATLVLMEDALSHKIRPSKVINTSTDFICFLVVTVFVFIFFKLTI